MKKKMIMLPILAVCLLTAVFAQATGAQAASVSAAGASETGIDGATLIVTGTASLRAEADECRFYGNIETVANDLRTAGLAGEEIYENVKTAFAPYGSIVENNVRISPVYGQSGYSSCRTLCFSTDRIDDIDEIRRTLAEAGLTGLDGVTYVCGNASDYRAAALRLAVDDARAKAEELNATGDLIRVEELSCYPCCRGYDGTSDASVTFTATVRAVFAARRTPEPRERKTDDGTEERVRITVRTKEISRERVGKLDQREARERGENRGEEKRTERPETEPDTTK